MNEIEIVLSRHKTVEPGELGIEVYLLQQQQKEQQIEQLELSSEMDVVRSKNENMEVCMSGLG